MILCLSLRVFVFFILTLSGVFMAVANEFVSARDQESVVTDFGRNLSLIVIFSVNIVCLLMNFKF